MPKNLQEIITSTLWRRLLGVLMVVALTMELPSVTSSIRLSSSGVASSASTILLPWAYSTVLSVLQVVILQTIVRTGLSVLHITMTTVICLSTMVPTTALRSSLPTTALLSSIQALSVGALLMRSGSSLLLRQSFLDVT